MSNVDLAGGTLHMEIAGSGEPGAAYDQVVFCGPLDLGEVILALEFLPGFDPAAGECIRLFDFSGASILAPFAAVLLPELANGLRWDTSALYGLGALGVSNTPLPASFWLLASAVLFLVGMSWAQRTFPSTAVRIAARVAI